jgi:hypothetical protein
MPRGDRGFGISVPGDAIGEGIGLNRGERMPLPDSAMKPGCGDMLWASGESTLRAGERSRTGLIEPSNRFLGRGDETGLRGGVDCDVGDGWMGDSERIGGLDPIWRVNSVDKVWASEDREVAEVPVCGDRDRVSRGKPAESLGERDLLAFFLTKGAFHGGRLPLLVATGDGSRCGVGGCINIFRPPSPSCGEGRVKSSEDWNFGSILFGRRRG